MVSRAKAYFVEYIKANTKALFHIRQDVAESLGIQSNSALGCEVVQIRQTLTSVNGGNSIPFFEAIAPNGTVSSTTKKIQYCHVGGNFTVLLYSSEYSRRGRLYQFYFEAGPGVGTV